MIITNLPCSFHVTRLVWNQQATRPKTQSFQLLLKLTDPPPVPSTSLGCRLVVSPSFPALSLGADIRTHRNLYFLAKLFPPLCSWSWNGLRTTKRSQFTVMNNIIHDIVTFINELWMKKGHNLALWLKWHCEWQKSIKILWTTALLISQTAYLICVHIYFPVHKSLH